MAAPNRREAPACRWSFTLNNYGDDDLARLRNIDPAAIKFMVVGAVTRTTVNNVPRFPCIKRKDYTEQRRPYTKTDNVVGNRIVDIEDLAFIHANHDSLLSNLHTSVALYSNKRLSFTQACMGVQLWRQGCPLKVFTTLNSLGVSQSVFSARGQVDRLRLGHDSQVNVWKQEVENIAASARRQLLFHQDAPSTAILDDLEGTAATTTPAHRRTRRTSNHYYKRHNLIPTAAALTTSNHTDATPTTPDATTNPHTATALLLVWKELCNQGQEYYTPAASLTALDSSEHVNNFLRSSLKGLGPNLTEQTASRISKSLGILKGVLGTTDEELGVAEPSGYHHCANRAQDIHSLVEVLRDAEDKCQMALKGGVIELTQAGKKQTYRNMEVTIRGKDHSPVCRRNQSLLIRAGPSRGEEGHEHQNNLFCYGDIITSHYLLPNAQTPQTVPDHSDQLCNIRDC
ncbi:Serine palmitoyltransferase 2 [Branchiostoma belcheri]|nr:Serine palmitoyltransferase 2 [Branchiostoma belcheri]